MSKLSRRSLLKSAAAASALPMLATPALAQAKIKAAFVYNGPVGDFGWTYAHDQGRLAVQKHFGDAVETTPVDNTAEGPDSERVIRSLADNGTDIIFATSFGYMNPTIKVAKRARSTVFEHATGFKTAKNVSTYNGRFFEGRAVCGTIAGMMSKTGIAGYIATFPIPDVVRDINAFTLAARRINPDFETRVIWASTWYDPAKEADAAKALADQGADVITQHTNSPAPLQVCEQRGLITFGQAWDMTTYAPTAHMTSIQNNWGVYYIDRIQKLMDGQWESGQNWWGLEKGVIEMTPYNERMPAEVQAAANATRDGIIDGSAPVFTGPIKDNTGQLRVAEGETLSIGDALGIDWYVEGVKA